MIAAAASGAEHAPRAVSVRIRLLAVVGGAVVAYSFSLRSLFGGWRYDTPLAHLALVPLLAALLLFAATQRYPHVAWLRLGRVDVVLAGLLLTAAFSLLAAGPAVWSTYFWASRLDLLTLPLFVAGALVLLFGARSLMSFVFPLGFLLLAWPLPYLILLEQTLDFFTRATALAVQAIVVPTGLASVDETLGSGAFVVSHAGIPFTVSVASACSGVNSLVGFFVVAAFGIYFVRGPVLRRLAWLATGALLVWCFNVLRVVSILVIGGTLGERAAFKVLHPISGLIAVNLAALALVLLMRRFGLRWRRDPVDVDSPLAATADPAERAIPRLVVPRLALLLVAAVAFALANGQLKAVAQGFSNDGRPAVAPYVTAPVAAPNWSVRRVERVRFATPYYGAHSEWVRYRLKPMPSNPRPFTIWLDAVTSPDLGALDAYTLAHCYAFHHFRVDVARRLDLGAGVVGQAFVYTTKDVHWHAVSWQWPVLGANGKVEHERIVLLARAPVRGSAEIPHHSGGFLAAALSLLNLRAPDDDDNPDLTEAMHGVASAMVGARIEGPA